jgi:predicted membrane-bound mannosyltransferase
MTVDGMARTEFLLEKVGRLLVRASSEPALSSTVLEITISASGNVVVATVVPTPTPTATRIPTATRTPTATPTPTITPLPDTVEAFFTRKPQNAQWGEFVLALSGVVLLGAVGFGAVRRRGNLTRALRASLYCASGGLIGYMYFTLGLPGSEALRVAVGSWGALVLALVGGVLPLLYWLRRE